MSGAGFLKRLIQLVSHNVWLSFLYNFFTILLRHGITATSVNIIFRDQFWLWSLEKLVLSTKCICFWSNNCSYPEKTIKVLSNRANHSNCTIVHFSIYFVQIFANFAERQMTAGKYFEILQWEKLKVYLNFCSLLVDPYF